VVVAAARHATSVQSPALVFDLMDTFLMFGIGIELGRQAQRKRLASL
jgi:hypothetical protein